MATSPATRAATASSPSTSRSCVPTGGPGAGTRAVFASLPLIVAIVEREERRAVGVTVEGVPIELTVAHPSRYGTELLRATGSPEYVASLGSTSGRQRRRKGVFAGPEAPLAPRRSSAKRLRALSPTR